jgi:uncharacterized membrane protein
MSNQVTQDLTVLGALPDIYRMWENFENFPIFMQNIKSVKKTGDRTSHWVMQGPLGTEVAWDAETTRLEENQRIAWNSKDNSTIKTSGQVVFTELSQNETNISVTLNYDPPAGAAGEALAELLANPEGRLKDDLQRFKEFVEKTSTRIKGAPER